MSFKDFIDTKTSGPLTREEFDKYMRQISPGVRLTDTFLAAYPRLYKARPCVVCAATADEERGWVKPQDVPGSTFTYWLCNECLDRKPTLEWDGEDLRRVTFP